MKHLCILFLIVGPIATFAQSTWTAVYNLKSDICYENQKPIACDPVYRTVVNEMSVIWTAGANPLAGSIRVEAKKVTFSTYVDDLFPNGFYSNFSPAETNQLVYVYSDVAWVNQPVFATAGYCKIQIRFQPSNDELTIQILGIQNTKCESGSFTEIIRELNFQKVSAKKYDYQSSL